MTVQACVFITGAAEGESNGLDCAGAGNLPACLLCPRSPSYWRESHQPASADPYDPELQYAPAQDESAVQLLDFGFWPGRQSKNEKETSWTTGPDAWCVLGCGMKTRLRSPEIKHASGRKTGGVPVHVTCAEAWNREHNRRNNARPADPDQLGS